MKKRGFTLIELLVVIAIIGILSSIVLVSMGGARKTARDGVRKTDMAQIGKAQEMYYGMTQAYLTAAGPTLPAAIGDYMLKTPSDPGSNNYVWISNSADAQQFCVYATLETDPVEYFATSQAGNFECATTPTLGACCY